MHVIFITLLVYNVNSQISDTKYIDLLPEKEKTEFLENIARRILEEVHGNNENKTLKSGEVPDVELEKHDAYVRQIMNEELEKRNLRKALADNDKRNTETSLDKIDTNDDDKQNVELATRPERRDKRENKRRVYSGFVPDEDDSEEYNAESDVDIQVKNFKINNKKYEQPVEITTLQTSTTSDYKDAEETTTQNVSGDENYTSATQSDIKQGQDLDSLQRVNNAGEITQSYNITLETTSAQSSSHIYENDEEKRITSANSAIENITDVNNVTTIENVTELKKDIIKSSEILTFSPSANSRSLRSSNQSAELNLNQNSDVETGIVQQSEVNKTSSTKNLEKELGDSKVITIKVTPATDSPKDETNSENITATEIYNEQQTSTTEKTTYEEISSTDNYGKLESTLVSNVDRNSTDLEHQTSSPIETTKVETISSIENQTKINKEALPRVRIIKETTTAKVEVLTTTDLPVYSSKLVNKEAIKKLINAQIHVSTYKKDKVKESVNGIVQNSLKEVPYNKVKGKYWFIHNLAEDMIRTLRQNFLEVIHKNEVPVQTDWRIPLTENIAKEYKVYEVPPGASPFVKQEPEKIKSEPPKVITKPPLVPPPIKGNFVTKEQPYYVPVYNYAPSNAFFDPFNIYGPDTGTGNENSSQRAEGQIKVSAQNNANTIKLLRAKEPFPLLIANNNPPITKEQPYYYPIYNYAPSNAFFDPYNIYGPNTNTDIENVGGSLNDDSEDESETNTMTQDDGGADSNTIIIDGGEKTELKNILNNFLNKIKLGITTPKPLNWRPKTLAKSVELTDANLDPYDNLVITFSNNQNEVNLRDKHKCHKKKCVKKDTDDDYFQTKPKYSFSSINKIREFLAEKNYFSYNNPYKKKREFYDKELDDDNNNTTELTFLRFKNAKGEGKYSEFIDKNTAVDYNIEKLRARLKPTKRAESGKTFDFTTVKKILDMTPTEDLIPMVLRLLGKKNNLKNTRRTEDIDAHVTVVGDMIKNNNRAMEQYGWLETTVDIQSAIQKTLEMIQAVKNKENMHPSDLELLKYLVHLHTTAKKLKNDTYEKELRDLLLPKSKKKTKGIKESGLLHRVWLLRMISDSVAIDKKSLDDFEEFINDLQNALFDMHTAITFISMVTKYTKQNWLQNLKQLYLDSTQKQLLEVTLHIYTSKLLWAIEDAVKEGLEDKALEDEKEKVINKITEDFIFILELLDEIKFLN